MNLILRIIHVSDDQLARLSAPESISVSGPRIHHERFPMHGAENAKCTSSVSVDFALSLLCSSLDARVNSSSVGGMHLEDETRDVLYVVDGVLDMRQDPRNPKIYVALRIVVVPGVSILCFQTVCIRTHTAYILKPVDNDSLRQVPVCAAVHRGHDLETQRADTPGAEASQRRFKQQR